jgi:FdhE protein
VCPSCGVADDKKLAYYSAEEIGHIRVQVCESCKTYIHTVDLGRDEHAIPDIDEITALPLDVWAHERDCRKIHPNLVGI